MTRPHTARRCRKHRRNRVGLPGGLGTWMLLAGLGMLLAAFVCSTFPTSGATSTKNTASVPRENPSALEQYLSPIVAQDPKPFSDLSHADRTWMLKTAIWYAAEQTHYPYTADNRQSVPVSDILAAYRKFFGNHAAPAFQTFTSDSETYLYHADTSTYSVPITARKNVYTPRVTQVKQHSADLFVTVGYLPSTGWAQKADGTVVPPSPSKAMRYTLRQDGNSMVLTSIQNT